MRKPLIICSMIVLAYGSSVFAVDYEDNLYTNPWEAESSKIDNSTEESNDAGRKRQRWNYDKNDQELLVNPWNDSKADSSTNEDQNVENLTNQFKKVKISDSTQEKSKSKITKSDNLKYKDLNSSEKLFNVGSYSKTDNRSYQDFARRHSKRLAEKRKKGW